MLYINSFLKLGLAYLIVHLLSENITLSTELLSKECENTAEVEFGVECLLNFYRTGFAEHRAKPNASALVYVSKA